MGRRGEAGSAIPAILSSAHYIVRGYGAGDRIVDGTGGVVATTRIAASAGALPERGDIAYVHVRSAANTCFQVRIERA